nr:hypothetical protein [Tanacetum cinerariifolium]
MAKLNQLAIDSKSKLLSEQALLYVEKEMKRELRMTRILKELFHEVTEEVKDKVEVIKEVKELGVRAQGSDSMEYLKILLFMFWMLESVVTVVCWCLYVLDVRTSDDLDYNVNYGSSGLRRFFRYAMLSIHSIYVMSLYPFTERYAQPHFFSCFIRQIRSSSRLISDQSSNPTSSTNTNPKGRNRRRSKQQIENSNLEE